MKISNSNYIVYAEKFITNEIKSITSLDNFFAKKSIDNFITKDEITC